MNRVDMSVERFVKHWEEILRLKFYQFWKWTAGRLKPKECWALIYQILANKNPTQDEKENIVKITEMLDQKEKGYILLEDFI